MKCRHWDHTAWTRRHVFIYKWQIHYGWKLHSRARICFWTTKQRTSFLQSPSKSLINCYKLSSYKAKKITNYKSQRELTKHMQKSDRFITLFSFMLPQYYVLSLAKISRYSFIKLLDLRSINLAQMQAIICRRMEALLRLPLYII